MIEEDEEARAAEQQLLRWTNAAGPGITSPHARRHLKEGFLQRLLILRQARQEIDAVVAAYGGRALGPGESVRLSLFLSAFYLHLAGALDNLAWTLAYAFGLKPHLADDDPESRRFCGLFNRRFLDALASHLPGVAALLRSSAPWHRELKALRDPAAHRIPPGFVSGTVPHEDVPKFHALMEEAERSLERVARGEGDDVALVMTWAQKRHEARGLARFSPRLVRFQPEGYELIGDLSVVAKDHEFLVALATCIVRALPQQQIAQLAEETPEEPPQPPARGVTGRDGPA